jgi:glutathione S-transferase
MLTIWGRPSSFNTQKVLWLVGELKLPHTHIPLGGSFGGLDAPEFAAMNPHRRVPVIDDAGTIVWESHTILRYLAARHGGPRFWSADAAQRSHAERWMDWAQTTLQPDFLLGVFWGLYRTPEHLRDWPAINEKVARCARHFALLDRVLADRSFLCGEDLTLADIPAGTGSTAISSSRSRGRPCPMSRPGTRASRRVRPIGNTSWCRLPSCAVGSRRDGCNAVTSPRLRGEVASAASG